ncbi:MAG: lipid-A-disaccharide synthase [Armatimonadota bacterium]|nr:MAG: lipid-A-disaccharide synthase [Armatimonadota bacterium]
MQAGSGGLETAARPGGLEIAVFAGDASGDHQASLLLPALRKRVPSLRCWGIGGRRLREAGMELLFDASQVSAIGFVQVARLIPDMLRLLKRARRELELRRPDMVLAVDAGAFNLRITPFARSIGIPVAYWFPPGSWRRDRLSAGVEQAADYFISPYPWYAEMLRQAGARADFLGHPLLDQVRPRMTAREFSDALDLDPGRSLVALLPGSRGHEVRHLLPVVLEAAALIEKQRPGRTAFAVALSDHFPAAEAAAITRKELERQEKRTGVRPCVALARGATIEALCHARAAAACSGSVTLEALVAGTPMVVAYRGSRLMKLEYRLRRIRIRYIAMPNILADAPVVPELRQDEATGEAIAAHLLSLLEDTPERAAQGRTLCELRSMLEPPGALDRTAEALLAWLRETRGEPQSGGAV